MLKLAGEIIEGQLADHKADLDAHHVEPFSRGYIGNLYNPLGVSLTTYTISANTLYALIIPIVRNMTFDRLYTKITVQAGQNLRLGAYNIDSDMKPSSLIHDYGEIALTGTGMKYIAWDLSAVIASQPYIFVVVVSDGTPSFSSINYSESPLGNPTSDPSRKYTGWTGSHTYGALPDPFPTPSLTWYMSYMGLRIKSLD